MGWKEEYLASIEEAEVQNPVNAELVDICTKLADKITVLEAEKEYQEAPAPPPPTTPKARTGYFSSPSPAPEGPLPETDPQLRRDLAEALRSKTQMETRLKNAESQLVRIKEQTARDEKSIRRLTSESNHLARKLKDRDEEIKGKNKLLEVRHKLSLTSRSVSDFLFQSPFDGDENPRAAFDWARGLASPTCRPYSLDRPHRQVQVACLWFFPQQQEEVGATWTSQALQYLIGGVDVGCCFCCRKCCRCRSWNGDSCAMTDQKVLTILQQEVQDELLTTTMELNIVREKEKKTVTENKELIERWMRLKSKEVDMMNERNEKNEPRPSRPR
ncbi:uncharacterized protein MKZ38_004433 [Zalerion maritima]|uniref:Autophagy-related protein 16 domain-containing protein n=1 Tax=Zalerion maritima TaxID=339359 RepID=A0AAD5RYG1_9PEZI|nr:uncharacterized protein MKZ38_004433 [Zalerion maritima]